MPHARIVPPVDQPGAQARRHRDGRRAGHEQPLPRIGDGAERVEIEQAISEDVADQQVRRPVQLLCRSPAPGIAW